MSENAILSRKSENEIHNNSKDIEFLEKLMIPDLRFEEFYLNNENILKPFNRLKKSRAK